MLTHPHPYPGKLIIVEGIDGSGKSTQLALLHRWLVAQGHKVFFTEWNSSVLVRRSMRRGKKKDLLTPTTFSLLHAVDFADRLTYKILPPLGRVAPAHLRLLGRSKRPRLSPVTPVERKVATVSEAGR